MKINNIFVDTNVLIRYLDDILNDLSDVGLIIPYICLEELDNLKNSKDGELGYLARKTVRKLYEIKKYGNLNDWIKLTKRNLSIMVYDDEEIRETTYKKNDDIILALMQKYSSINGGKSILLTNDINLSLKSEALGFDTQTYEMRSDLYKNLYDGISHLVVADRIIQDFYKDGYIDLELLYTFYPVEECLYENQFLMMQSNNNPKSKAIGIKRGERIEKCKYLNSEPYGIKPRNIEQKLAIELLMRDDIPLVTFAGSYGSAKTMLMLGASLEKVLDPATPYKKILLVKPPMPLDSNLMVGYKPGDLRSKYLNTLGSITSNLEVLKEVKDEKSMNGVKLLDGYVDQEVMEIVSVEDILGSSYNNCIVLCEETQLLTKENMEALVSRVGENSRVYMNGDLKQGSRLVKKDPRELGLYHLIKVFKDSKLAGHLTLKSIQRSSLVEELSRKW